VSEHRNGIEGAGLRDRLEAALRGAGLSDDPGQFDSDMHSWRCKYPDIYGPCSCFSDLLDDLLNAAKTPAPTTAGEGERGEG
jgi:hypothetical protein